MGVVLTALAIRMELWQMVVVIIDCQMDGRPTMPTNIRRPAPRKGIRIQVIKDHKVIAICENAGEAMRLTHVHYSSIYRKLQDGSAIKGYRFKRAESCST